MERQFGNIFLYKRMWVEADNHIVYKDINLLTNIDWESGDKIEAIFNPEDGTLFFQEWVYKSNIWNKSPTLRFSVIN